MDSAEANRTLSGKVANLVLDKEVEHVQEDGDEEVKPAAFAPIPFTNFASVVTLASRVSEAKTTFEKPVKTFAQDSFHEVRDTADFNRKVGV